MIYTRRRSLQLGTATLAGVGAATLLPLAGRAQDAMSGEKYEGAGGEVTIHPVEHASLALALPGLVLYSDPVGGAARYEGLPPPGLILVTHRHGDHFDVDTLNAIVTDNTRILTNADVHGMMPAELQEKATVIAAGETASANDIGIAAIPAYNTSPELLDRHPKARGDNGYVLDVGGERIYIAGDTEDIPEMRALEGINVAFLPMNTPTMTIEQAASAVAEFAPGFVYPYHYGESDTEAFAALVSENAGETVVVLHDWYPGA